MSAQDAELERGEPVVEGADHVPWHEALSEPCWCGRHHEPVEAFEMNAPPEGAAPKERHECWLPERSALLGAPLDTIIRCPVCGQKWVWQYGYNTLELMILEDGDDRG